MGHLGIGKEEVFQALAKRLDQNPIGAPLNTTLMQILYTLYSEQEAEIGSTFPQGFAGLDKLTSLTGIPAAELRVHLDNMAAKGLVIDIPRPKNTLYMLTPLVIGFFEYTFMRVTEKLPLPELAELFERYHHEKGVAEEFFGAETKLFQTWPYESSIPADIETEVLDYEKASAMIRDAGGGSLTMCYCRHQALHRGTVCSAPIQDVCTSLGSASEWLVRRGFARPASVDELLRVLDRTEALGLVHLADNVQHKPAYICHCCGCCCGVLRSINEHNVAAVQPSNFLPQLNPDSCVGCGQCIEACHIKALSTIAAAQTATGQTVQLNPERCIGCGACVKSCPSAALMLVRRQHIYQTPKDKREQMRRIAQGKGR